VIENAIHVEPFTAARFTETVKQAGGGIITRQVEYLALYLQRLKVATVVRETRYIDRHFMDEYALFYNRLLNPPKNTVTRLHFFEKAFDRSALTRWMRDAMRGRDRRRRSRRKRAAITASARSAPSQNRRSVVR